MGTSDLKVERMDGVCLVEVLGAADFASSSELDAALSGLLNEGHLNVVVDLGKTDMIGSTTIGVLLGCAGRFRRRGGELRICCVPAVAAPVFEVVGICRFVATYEDRTGALLDTPVEVRERLDLAERRTLPDRREKDSPPKGKDRRAKVRRRDDVSES